MATSWGRRWYQRLLGGAPRRHRGRYRPWLEALEDRTVPSFLAAANFPTDTSPFAVAVADLNGDGKPDLIVTNYKNPGAVSVLLGKGNGTFGAAQNLTTGSDPRSVALADVNADGLLHLAVVNELDGTASVLLGQRR